MLLTPYGLREWLAITVVMAAIAAALAFFSLWWWMIAPLIVWLAIVSFFRDPSRRVPTDLAPGAMISPADGAVSAVLTVDHHDAAGGPAVIVRVFLSVLNVHVNRAPCDAEVVAIQHRPGKYLNAQTEESAKVNESNLITLRLGDGRTIGVRQVAGMIARRIVCATTVGTKLTRGEKFGMIKFGSTAELIMPDPGTVDVHVTKGEKVRGGLTVLATMRDRA